jgi:hypothetical protein
MSRRKKSRRKDRLTPATLAQIIKPKQRRAPPRPADARRISERRREPPLYDD